MKEIEVKILEINPEEVRKKLLDLGAEKVFDGEIHSICFDFPDGRLEKEGAFARVRKVGDKVELCFKGKKENSLFKIREETEVVTNNFGDTVKIIEELGLRKFHEIKRRRESYSLGKIRFEIDTYPTMPVFLEIEAPTEEEVVEYVERLGYTMEQTSNLTAFKLEEYYRKKK